MKRKDAFVDLTDVRLHYVEEGDGPLVVLLHGFPDFWYSWRHQIPALSEAGFRVVAPDMRGYNTSDKPRGVSNYTLDRLATDVVELVAALGGEAAQVVGHDWGGVVAWAVAGWHPDVVERLVVMNAPHPDDYARGLKNPKQLAKSWYAGFFQLPGSAAALRAGGFAPLRRALRLSSTPGAFTDEDIALYEVAWSEPRAIESQLQYCRAGARRLGGGPGSVPTVTAPTLVIWGEKDTALEPLFATPPPELVADLTVETLPEATHWVHMDDPDRVNELMLDFLA